MLRSLFLDFNSYFASVEQQLNPDLRGRPVAVVAVMSDSSCCIAASYAAKKHGIKTGTNIGDAKRLCPDLVLIKAQHKKYVEMHHEAVRLVGEVVPVRQVRSIDEMECELTGRWRARERALLLAREVKSHLRQHLGECMTTSIGIAPNTMLSKLASNLHKPDGLTVLDLEDIPARIYPLPVTVINGVGARMEQRLARYGLYTVADLYVAPRGVLRNAWGSVEGSSMYDKLRGAWYEPRTKSKQSISHSHVLPPEQRTAVRALGVLDRLTQKAAMRLRKEGYYARAVSIFAKCRRENPKQGKCRRYEATVRVGETQDTPLLLHAVQTLWQNVVRQSAPALFKPQVVGLVLFDLVPAGQHTLDLFDGVLKQKPCDPMPTNLNNNRECLHKVLDSLNTRHGKNTIYFASAHQARDEAPMRIAFQRIPDAATE